MAILGSTLTLLDQKSSLQGCSKKNKNIKWSYYHQFQNSNHKVYSLGKMKSSLGKKIIPTEISSEYVFFKCPMWHVPYHSLPLHENRKKMAVAGGWRRSPQHHTRPPARSVANLSKVRTWRIWWVPIDGGIWWRKSSIDLPWQRDQPSLFQGNESSFQRGVNCSRGFFYMFSRVVGFNTDDVWDDCFFVGHRWSSVLKGSSGLCECVMAEEVKG